MRMQWHGALTFHDSEVFCGHPSPSNLILKHDRTPIHDYFVRMHAHGETLGINLKK